MGCKTHKKRLVFLLVVSLFMGFTYKKETMVGKKCEYAENNQMQFFYQVLDSIGLPLYYYMPINQYPCTDDNTCKKMVLTMYWDIYGQFLQIELPKGERLTKVNHKDFNAADYLKLHKILNNPNAEFQFCNYDDLSSKQCENQYHVDAVSGATNEDIKFEYINGAIKTTYALWKIANGAICNAIAQETKASLEKHFVQHKKKLPTFSESALQSYFTAMPDDAKMYVLNAMQKSDSSLNTVFVDKIKNGLYAQNQRVYSGELNLIAAQKNKASFIKSNLLPELEKADPFHFLLTYNAIQRSGNNRLLKKYDFTYWENERYLK